MSLLRKIPEYVIDENQKLRVKAPEVYLDDVYDPFFNRNARAYLKDKYGYGPIFTTLAGMSEVVDNALLGQKDNWGILGPGMGILSSFGRSMDKTGDFIIGGITEGVNTVGNLFGSKQPIEDPIKNIFVEDEDYSGRRLLTAMANSMSGLAGGKTIEESDLSNVWNIPGLGLDLATDPGILGGSLSKANPILRKMSTKEILENIGNAGLKSSVSNIGELLYRYDNLMSNVALDLTAPGLRQSLKLTLNKILDLVEHSTTKEYVNTPLNEVDPSNKTFPTAGSGDVNDAINTYTETDENLNTYFEMAENLAKKYNINIVDTPEEWATLTKLRNKRIPKYNYNGDLYDYGISPDVIDKMIAQETATAAKEQAFYLKEFDRSIRQHEDLKLQQINSVFSPNNPIVTAYTTINNMPLGEALDTAVSDTLSIKNLSKKNSVISDFSKVPNKKVKSNRFIEPYKKSYEVNGETYSYGVPITRTEPIIPTFSTGKSFQTTSVLEAMEKDPEVIEDFLNTIDESELAKSDSNAYYTFLKILDNPEDKNRIKRFLKNIEDQVYEVEATRYLQGRLDSLVYSKALTNFSGNYDDIAKTPVRVTVYNSPHGERQPLKSGVQYAQSKLKIILKKHLGLSGTQYENPKTVLTELFKKDTDLQTYLRKNESEIYVPGLYGLIKPKQQMIKGMVRDASIYTYYDNLTEFVKFINSIRYTPLSQKALYQDLINFADDINDNILQKIVHKDSVDLAQSLRDLFSMLNGNITLDQAIKLQGTLSEFDVQINGLGKNKILNHPIFGKIAKQLKDQPGSIYYQTNYLPFKSTHIAVEENLHNALKNNIDDIFSDMDNTEFSKMLVRHPTFSTINRASFIDISKADTTINQFFSKEYQDYLNDFGSWTNFKDFIHSTGDPKTVYLFDLLQKAKSVPEEATSGDKSLRQTLRLKKSQQLFTDSEKLMKKYGKLDVYKYLTLRDAVSGDVVKAENFLSELVASRNGFLLTVLPKNHKGLKDLTNSIQNNIDAVNQYGNLIKSIQKKLENGDTVIGYMFDNSNTNIVKKLNKLSKKKLPLEDVVFQKANPAHLAQIQREFPDLDMFFNQLQELSQDLSKKIGFQDVNSVYFKHTLGKDAQAASWLKNTIYKDIPLDDLSDIAAETAYISDMYGVFGNLPNTRSLRGSISRYNRNQPVFSTDLTEIAKSTLGDGIFDNAKVQTWVGLFENDNFKISKNFNSKEDLKRVLQLKDGDAYTGNLDNLTLATPIYDETGKIIKIKKFDKYSDKSLEAAFKDGNAILIPDYVLAPLDSILKKNIKMSNKVYQIFNRYITLPFKYGIIANPGFLVSNISDATFKQVLTMSQKYGTSFTEEIGNMIYAMRMTSILNNQFSDIYAKYVKAMKNAGKPIPVQYLPFDMLASNPKAKKLFIDFINNNEASKILTQDDIAKSNLWIMLNNVQNTARHKKVTANSEIFKNNYQDLGDLKQKIRTKYSPKKNLFERLLYGKGDYTIKNPLTWGIFQDNPWSNFIVNTSGSIETLARSSSVLNDLLHTYDIEDLKKLLRVDETVEASVKQQLDVDVMNAVNTMHNINYDYTNTSKMMDAASRIFPFPTFFMKNFAYWMQMLIENPQVIDNILSVQEGLWGGREDDTKNDTFLAEAKGRGAIPFGQKVSKFFKGIYKPSPLNSMFGAFNLLNEPIENLSFRTNPALSLATSLTQPDEEVKYRPYSTNPYERNITRDKEEFNQLKYLFHRLNPYEKVIQNYPRIPKKLKWEQAQLADFLPSIFQPDFSKKSKKK